MAENAITRQWGYPVSGNPATAGVVDVDYGDQGQATSALVVCQDSAFAWVLSEHVAHIARTEPYEPGEFYKRELPCIQAVLALGAALGLLIVDGYATLDPRGRPGLGARTSEAIGIPVIGIAKTPFRTATHAVEVTRGGATKPLYVTSSGGIAIAEAASIVAAMAGPHRLPFALARVDSLARGRAQPIFG